MYCVKCGSELGDGVNFCTSCGSEIGTTNNVHMVGIDKFYESDIIMNAIVQTKVEYYQEVFRKIANNDTKGTKAMIWAKSTLSTMRLVKSRKMEEEFSNLFKFNKLMWIGLLATFGFYVTGFIFPLLFIFCIVGFVIFATYGVRLSFMQMSIKQHFNKIYFEKIKKFIMDNRITELNINTVEIQKKIQEVF